MRPAIPAVVLILASSAGMAVLLRPTSTLSAPPAPGPADMQQQLQSITALVNSLEQRLVTQQGQLVPVGAVIAFWGKRDEVPAEYAICDGTTIVAAESPLHGRPTPDLTERFIQGAAVAHVDVRNGGHGFAGGENTTTAFATQETVLTVDQMPNHTHGVNEPPHTHSVPVDSFWTKPGGAGVRIILPNANSPDPANTRVKVGRVEALAQNRVAFDNVERFSLTDPVRTGLTVLAAGGGKGHSHVVPPHENRPAYVEMIYIMRVR